MVRKTIKLEIVQLDQTLFYLNYLQLESSLIRTVQLNSSFILLDFSQL